MDQSEDGPAQDPVADAEDRAARAVARYREVVASTPDLVPELVRGDTVEEIDASAQEARRVYADIRQQIAARHEHEVPAGNPARSGSVPGADTLSPEAKIALALRRTK